MALMRTPCPVFQKVTIMFDVFAPKPPKEDMGPVTIRVPLKLRDEFNALCIRRGVTTTEAIRNFMTQAVAQDKEPQA